MAIRLTDVQSEVFTQMILYGVADVRQCPEKHQLFFRAFNRSIAHKQFLTVIVDVLNGPALMFVAENFIERSRFFERLHHPAEDKRRGLCAHPAIADDESVLAGKVIRRLAFADALSPSDVIAVSGFRDLFFK